MQSVQGPVPAGWAPTVRPSASPPHDDGPPPYVVTPRGIFQLLRRAESVEEKPLANFTARIVAEIVRDDGQEQTRTLAIEGERQGHPLPAVNLSVVHRIGTGVFPGKPLIEKYKHLDPWHLGTLGTFPDIPPRFCVRAGWQASEREALIGPIDDYPGSKGGNGVYHRIIGQQPPHRVYVRRNEMATGPVLQVW